MSDIKEALTAAGVPALIQKTIDPLLLEYQRRFSPLIRAVPTKKITSSVYYFNRRTSRAPGGFVTDGGARPMTNSTYEQFQFTIRLLQSVGGVTGYAQEVTRGQIGDLRAQEIASAVQGLLWDIEQGIAWGCDAATRNGPWPQFDGLDVLCSQFVSTPTNRQNAIDFAGASLAFTHLDQIMEVVQSNSAMPSLGEMYMFVMSSKAISRISQLETPLQRFLTSTEVAAGLNVTAYRGIPMVPSSFLGNSFGSMGVVSTATATTGGTLAAATYYYTVEPVMTRSGLLAPSAEVSQVTTGSTSTATLTFSVPAGAEGATPMSYRVYRGTSTGAGTLLGIVDAVAGTMADGITPIYATSIVDNGTTLTPTAAGPTVGVPAATYAGGSTAKPRAAGAEDIYLIPKDPGLLLRPYVRDVTPLEVFPTTASPDQLPFALATDTCLAVRAPKFISRARNVVATL